MKLISFKKIFIIGVLVLIFGCQASQKPKVNIDSAKLQQHSFLKNLANNKPANS